jgi:hypothetical protein
MLRNLALAALLASASACGSSTTSPSAYNQTVTGSVDVFGTNRHSLSTPRSGTMTLTLSWQDALVDLDLYLANTSCTVLYPKSSCSIVQSSSMSGGTSERISRTVSSGESYNIFVDNLSVSRTQTYTLTINIQ